MFKAIEIDFEVYKALTGRLATEASTYNDVIRSLLELQPTKMATLTVADVPGSGWTYRGVNLPNGTQLRANYKRQVHTAEITGGQWIQDGQAQTSPSAAGNAITQTGLNGWTFWEAKRPGDTTWVTLDWLRKEAKAGAARKAA